MLRKLVEVIRWCPEFIFLYIELSWFMKLVNWRKKSFWNDAKSNRIFPEEKIVYTFYLLWKEVFVHGMTNDFTQYYDFSQERRPKVAVGVHGENEHCTVIYKTSSTWLGTPCRNQGNNYLWKTLLLFTYIPTFKTRNKEVQGWDNSDDQWLVVRSVDRHRCNSGFACWWWVEWTCFLSSHNQQLEYEENMRVVSSVGELLDLWILK